MSIELPDGKVCRSLPEQVAENAKNIKTISEILDGLNIQDNLVVIADLSQILTRSELDIVERPVAFLYYGDQLYIKKNEVGGSAFFNVIFSISGSTVISFASKEIEVNLSTGALALTTSTVSTYSKDEIDSLFYDKTYIDTQLASKADLSGANFTGNITAPSIIENMSGYSFAKQTNLADATLEYKYVGVCKNGNKITFVLFAKINFSVLPISGIFNLGSFYIPGSVGTKLFPFSGSDLSYDECLFYSAYNIKATVNTIMKKTTDQIVFPQFYSAGLSVNTDYYLRYEKTFLLSENLAS